MVNSARIVAFAHARATMALSSFTVAYVWVMEDRLNLYAPEWTENIYSALACTRAPRLNGTKSSLHRTLTLPVLQQCQEGKIIAEKKRVDGWRLRINMRWFCAVIIASMCWCLPSSSSIAEQAYQDDPQCGVVQVGWVDL